MLFGAPEEQFFETFIYDALLQLNKYVFEVFFAYKNIRIMLIRKTTFVIILWIFKYTRELIHIAL